MAEFMTGPKRVLMIDNDAGRAFSLLFHLRETGFDCAAVATFGEANAFLLRSAEIGYRIDAVIIAQSEKAKTFAQSVRSMPAWENLPIVIAQDRSEEAITDDKSASNSDQNAKADGLLDTITGLLQLHQGRGFDVHEKAALSGLEPAANAAIDILVAEDNDINQLVIAQFLDTTGHSYRIVASGRCAVHAFRYMRPQIILMDLSMPDMNGKEATAAIRALESRDGGRIPIVALTAHALKGDREDCLAAGMDHYLSKPIHFETLNALLDLYLRTSTKAA